MKLNVELLETLKCELCNWKSFDEAQLQHKMRAFEKFPRAEYSTFYKPILTNECLMNSLVELGEAFFANSNLLSDVVSSMGYIIRRYGYVPSTTVFCLFTRAATNKKSPLLCVFTPIFFSTIFHLGIPLGLSSLNAKDCSKKAVDNKFSWRSKTIASYKSPNSRGSCSAYCRASQCICG